LWAALLGVVSGRAVRMRPEDNAVSAGDASVVAPPLRSRGGGPRCRGELELCLGPLRYPSSPATRVGELGSQRSKLAGFTPNACAT